MTRLSSGLTAEQENLVKVLLVNGSRPETVATRLSMPMADLDRAVKNMIATGRYDPFSVRFNTLAGMCASTNVSREWAEANLDQLPRMMVDGREMFCVDDYKDIMDMYLNSLLDGTMPSSGNGGWQQKPDGTVSESSQRSLKMYNCRPVTWNSPIWQGVCREVIVELPPYDSETEGIGITRHEITSRGVLNDGHISTFYYRGLLQPTGYSVYRKLLTNSSPSMCFRLKSVEATEYYYQKSKDNEPYAQSLDPEEGE